MLLRRVSVRNLKESCQLAGISEEFIRRKLDRGFVGRQWLYRKLFQSLAVNDQTSQASLPATTVKAAQSSQSSDSSPQSLLLLIRGEPGIGKSTLLCHLLTRFPQFNAIIHSD